MHDALYYAELIAGNDMKNVIGCYDNIIKETEAYIKDLKKNQQQLECIMQECKTTKSEFSLLNMKSDFIKTISHGYNVFLKHQMKMYKEASRFFGYVYDLHKLQESHLKDFLINTRYINAKVYEDSLFVKLPQIPVKYYMRSNIFVDELRFVLSDIYNTTPLFIKQKSVQIIHVFNPDFNGLVPDNDNYDFKCIMDTITDFVSGGDSGVNCWYELLTIISDEIEEGSYIIVSPQNETKRTNIIDKIGKCFEQK